ncbi:MAG: hypothetical protein MHPSP_003955, partial [Paramarteilia canceri]
IRTIDLKRSIETDKFIRENQFNILNQPKKDSAVYAKASFSHYGAQKRQSSVLNEAGPYEDNSSNEPDSSLSECILIFL